MTSILFLIGLGTLVGTLSGALGIGGGIILIPALTAFMGLSQQQAQGNTLAMMVPPIGILAAYGYYQQGLIDLKLVTWLCLGFIVGGFLGAKIALMLPTLVLKRVFGGFLVLIGIKYLVS